MPPASELFSAYRDYKAAIAAMLVADSLDWPGDPLRNAVQAQGMRFCMHWKTNAETIAEMVRSHPALFPEYHTPDKKGNLPDPREYSQHHVIMPRILE